jgi:hypothetical protein
MKQQYFSWIRNPMTIIALFVGLTELAFGLAFSKVAASLQSPFTWFMVLFATACAIGFFIVLFFRPQNFYGPGDFRSDETYLAVNRRIADVEAYAKLIDEKIESMPLYRYPKLTECSKVLFLKVYHEEKGIGIRTADEIIDDLRKHFSATDIQVAIQQLASEGWLFRDGDSIAPTPEGQKAHRVLSQFVYARLK